MKMIFSFIWFLSKLIVINLSFIAKLTTKLLVSTFSNYKLLIGLYLIIFSQVLLLIFNSYLQTRITLPSPLLSKEEYQQEVSNVFNLDQVEIIEVPLEKESLSTLFNQLEEQQQSFTTRDGLINQALIELLLNHPDKYHEYLQQAQELDPNWVGWNK